MVTTRTAASRAAASVAPKSFSRNIRRPRAGSFPGTADIRTQKAKGTYFIVLDVAKLDTPRRSVAV